MQTQMLTTKQLMAATGLGADRLAQHEQAGIIKRAGRNSWPAVETLSALVVHYRSESRRGYRSAADAELRQARVREIEIRTAERERRLIPVTDAADSMSAMIGLVLTELSGHPARCTRDLALRRRIEDEVFGIRERLSDRMRKVSEQLLAGRLLGEALEVTKSDVTA
jgi:hypothetical protein